jgi:pimeloyl-ACP methyl ester carboxylesterase
MASTKRIISLGLGGFALWRLFGPEVPPRFSGPQERPSRLTGRTVMSGRQEFFVREAGSVGAPPIVLLHGWVYDSLVTWHRVIPILAETHRVYIIDLRSHGKSAQIRGRVDIEDMADEIAGVMDGLGLGLVPVVGYSMGGMVAQTLARRHPGRVSKLVLAATAARPILFPQWVSFPVFYMGRAMARLDRVIAPRIAYRYLLGTGVIPAHHAAWLWESLMDRDVDLYYQAGFAILRFDASKWVDKISAPTLSIIPTRDQLVPASPQRQTAAALGDNVVVEIEGARHEAVLTHSTEVAKAIRDFVS